MTPTTVAMLRWSIFHQVQHHLEGERETLEILGQEDDDDTGNDREEHEDPLRSVLAGEVFALEAQGVAGG